MKVLRTRYLFFWVILLFNCLEVQGQRDSARVLVISSTDIQRLRQSSLEFGIRSSSWKQEALQLAGEKGLTVRESNLKGRDRELIRLGNRKIPIYYTTDNMVAARTISTKKMWNGGSLGLALTGVNDTIREWDGGAVRATHVELTGRVIQGDGSVTMSNHATHVAGTMIATGVDTNAHGMANQAKLRAFDWTNDFAEMASEAAMGALVSNHSYGYIAGWELGSNGSWYWYGDTAINRFTDYTFGFYLQEAADVDNIAKNAPYYLVCKSAGNDRLGGPSSQPVSHYVWGSNNWILASTVRNLNGAPDGFDCIGSGFGVSKNILTVGAVYDIPNGYLWPSDVVLASFSGTGPTDDGRIKPDVVANGTGLYSPIATNNTSYDSYSGTSMATPNVTGSLILLQQYYKSLYGSYMRSATLKGIVIHTADEAGTSAGPDYKFGWGLLNCATASRVIRWKGGISLINEQTLANGSTYTLNINANGVDPLRATVCWTDTPGTPPAASLNPSTLMLVNDLDLRIDGTVLPWVLNSAVPTGGATAGDNTRDNVEQVYISAPSAGNHTITVTHKGTLNGGSQPFSLIVTGIYTGVEDPIPFSAIPFSSSTIQLNWTKNSAGDNVMIAWSSSESFGTPVNGSVYVAGNVLPGGGTVIYNGSSTFFSHSSLTANSKYYYKAFSVTGSNLYSYGRETSASTFCTTDPFPVTETFNAETTLPDCWDQEVNATGISDVWTISNSTNAGGTTNEAMASYTNVNPGTTRLKTFFFNTIGINQLQLSFRHLLDDYAEGATLGIQSSSDGINWTNEAWSMATVSNDPKGPYLVNTTVQNNLNSPTTQIAFVITGNLWMFDYWYIDDVEIKASGYWVGGTPGMPLDWNTASNWGDGMVPTASTDVYIPATTSLPVVSNDPSTPAECNNLVIESNSSLTIDTGKKLIVNGILTKKQ